jgi:hypothetical protein
LLWFCPGLEMTGVMYMLMLWHAQCYIMFCSVTSVPPYFRKEKGPYLTFEVLNGLK